MAGAGVADEEHDYSVFALPPEDVNQRLKAVMKGLRSDFGGPEFEPHITVVGIIRLTKSDALQKFNSACEGLKSFTAQVDSVATGTFFYQCVFLRLHTTPEVMSTAEKINDCFGYKNSTPYMPHLSLLYGDLTDEEKKKAQEKAEVFDENIGSLTFQISRLALYKIDTDWEKVAECSLVLPLLH
ncbi:cyclic phosphodiesterase-like [Macadamia integrifolia]|uniref:cyclic phosphodiesterase-like n=1 Tax=Macadamia integrifolia TaxID=60698 RepID=UPI001C4E82BD|nr:cyclic phosphodiesterase-like [Macadamia integrifolia]